MDKELIFKTKKFKEGITLDKEDFRKDFGVFLNMPREVAESINEIYKEKSAFMRGTDNNIRLISEKIKYNPVEVAQIHSVMINIINLLEKGENTHDLLSDLLLGEYITEDEVRKAKERIELISDTVEKWRIIREVAKTEQWGAPVFYGCSTSADLRLQTKKPFNALENIEKYNPEVENLIPMGLIEVNLKKYSGEESFSFQLTLEELRILKNLIISLEKELLLLDKIAKKYK